MDMADRMAADGYRDAGYEYVNLDDCWSAKERDAEGRLQGDLERFPSGMKALADYVRLCQACDFAGFSQNLLNLSESLVGTCVTLNHNCFVKSWEGCAFCFTN